MPYIVLTDGFCDPHTAKTAICVLRYRAQDVAAVLDRANAGRTCQELFGVGGAIPVVAEIDSAPQADALLIGIAPPGGKIPALWRPIILNALQRGMNVVSGLHDFLIDDAEFVRAALASGSKLIDLRTNDERDVSSRLGLREDCLRLHTIGNDCSVGKMVTAVELTAGLKRAGLDAQFVATGQTGILVAGGGCAIDRVIVDFAAGAAEKLVLANQRHQAIVVEGQGSLFHPRYSGVTLSLLHGVAPHGLVLCYAMGRTTTAGMDHVPLPPLEKVVEVYETMANLMNPCRVIGAAINGGGFDDDAVHRECEEIELRLGLPACDVLRHGPEKLVQAAMLIRK